MEDQKIFEQWELFKDLLKSTQRPGVENVIKWLDNSDFKFAPASTQYHNDFRGGLLNHSLNVYNILSKDLGFLTEYFELPQDTIILTTLLHDVCKVNFYNTSYRNTKNEEGQWIKVPYYTVEDQQPWGHGEKSVIELLKNGLILNDIEISMIRNHMGFSEDEKISMVSHCFSKYPQCLVLYFADMIATYIPESKDLPSSFRQKLIGDSITTSLILYKDFINKQQNGPYGDGLPF